MTRSLRLSLVTFLLTALAATAQADLFLTEVVDGTLTGGQPKWVELQNSGNVEIDLSQYSIGNYNNGDTVLGGDAATPLSGTLGTCQTYVIAYDFEPAPGEQSQFELVYGFAPDLYIGPFVNGDDVIALFLGAATGDGSDATLVDVYGDVGVDGTGTAWEYTDSYAYRLSGVTMGSPTWNAAEWFVAGPDALEGVDDVEETQNLLDNTTPGAHDCFPPTPTEDSTWGTIKSHYR